MIVIVYNMYENRIKYDFNMKIILMFRDPELKERICRFISKKADYLFITPSEKEEKERKTSDYEGKSYLIGIGFVRVKKFLRVTYIYL